MEKTKSKNKIKQPPIAVAHMADDFERNSNNNVVWGYTNQFLIATVLVPESMACLNVVVKQCGYTDDAEINVSFKSVGMLSSWDIFWNEIVVACDK